MTSSGTGSLAKDFFLAPARPRTWLNVVYLLIAFPLGLLYFVFLVVGGSVGISLALLWVGLPLLLVTVGAWWAFAAFERILARYLLGMDAPYAPRPWEAADGVLGKLRAHFTAASTWKDLAFVLLKFPLGLISSVLLGAFGGAAAALLFAPAFGPWTTGRSAWVGSWQITHGWEALLSILLGLVAFFVTLNLANGLTALWRPLVGALLGGDEPGQAPAQPTPPLVPPVQGPPMVPQAPAPPTPPTNDAPRGA
jgi:Putative sensor